MSAQSKFTCGHAKHNTQRLYASENIRRAASDLQNYDIIYHRLELNASPNKFFLTGSVTSYFRFTQDANTIAFNLRNHMSVDSVKQRGNQLIFSHNQDIVTINLPAFYSKGYLDSVTVFYSGNPTQGKYRSFFIEGHKSGKLLATQSEPYGAPDWWPCKQDLTDKFDSCDIIITTDTGYLAGGPGVLIRNEQINDSQVLYHWRHRYPSNFYLLGLAISNYKVIKDSIILRGKNIPIVNYVYPHSVDYATPLVKSTVPLLRVFDSVFGAYPYANEKYGHMQWNTSGGMEHATMSSMGAFNFDLVSHELAHQWFGDMVTCASWQDIWLNESFATYLNAVSYELLFNKDTFYLEMGKVLNNAKKENDQSIFVIDTGSVASIFNQNLTYQKGAMVLHTLRYHLGDSAFFQACRNYLADPQLTYGTATTLDLINHFQALTQKDMPAFFSSHYYGKGYPNYLIRWIQTGLELNVEVTQAATNSTTTFFRQTIPLHVLTDTGTLILKLEMDEKRKSFSYLINSKITEIGFNNHNEILAAGTVAEIDEDGGNDILVFPNPGNGNLKIKSNKSVIQSVILIGNEGKKILEYHNINEYNKILSLGHLSKGNYFLLIETEGTKYVKRYEKI